MNKNQYDTCPYCGGEDLVVEEGFLICASPGDCCFVMDLEDEEIPISVYSHEELVQKIMKVFGRTNSLVVLSKRVSNAFEWNMAIRDVFERLKRVGRL